MLKYLHEYKKISGNVELTDALKDEIPTSKTGGLGGDGSKFYEASKKKNPDSELMIVEGDSALSNILKVRNKAKNAGYHALLPLRGKIINTAKSDFEKAFKNKEIKTLFKVMGAGIEGVNFDIDALSYGKIIIMTDSDPDGAAICALLLAAFAKYAPEIIRAGRLYVMITPLYGQNKKYIFNEEDLDKDKSFARFKGLGSLEPEHILDVIFGDEINFVMLEEASTAFAMYENNELDYAAAPLEQMDRLMDSNEPINAEFVAPPRNCTFYYGFVMEKEAVSDVNVRKALSMAIDRQIIVDAVLKGGQAPANAFTNPMNFGSPAGDRTLLRGS